LDKSQLGRTVVHEHDIAIAVLADLQRLAGADRDDMDLDAGRLGKGRQQMVEQPRFLGRGGRGDGDEGLIRGNRGGGRGQAKARGGERPDPAAHIAAALRAVLRISCAVALIASTRANRMMPRPSASARSPRLVSSVIAVVIVRVTPAMLPPTIRIAPTSAAARPMPANTAVNRLKRPSQSNDKTVWSRPTPS